MVVTNIGVYMKTILLNGQDLTLDMCYDIAYNKVSVEIDPNNKQAIDESAQYVKDLVKRKEVVYGINTGFGKFSQSIIDEADIEKLQANLIRSHACGVGDYFDDEIVRLIMALRVNALVQGYSGIRYSTLELLIDMINNNILPQIPEKGSLGSSGDLAPLSHMVLTMMGEGTCKYNDEVMDSAEALKQVNLQPVSLVAKEGLALINGTQVLTAVGTLVTIEAIALSKMADITASMTFEALRGIVDAFDREVQLLRHHVGQEKVANNIRRCTKQSELLTKPNEIKVQDSYSLRCLPQIHGASKDAIDYVREKVLFEINAVTDNPLIFVERNQVISSGNFHGQPMALSFDFLGIALSEIANASERRIERLVNPSLSGLPAFLTEKGGTNSGFMIMQYTAASLVSENKVLAHPASVDSIPSSGNQEDHVSMGTIAANKAMQICKNVQYVLAIELLTAAQGLDFHQPKRLGDGTQVAYDLIRQCIKHVEEDRFMAPDIQLAKQVIVSHTLIKEVEKIIGKLE